MARLVRRLPVVVILGATGAGKSKAAFEIALKFNGEIISADSMQIYKGLDIVTNKVSREEQQQVPHHMVDVVSPLKSDFNIHNFRQMVIPKIERILGENKLPVIVGGTNYYIESVLWDFLIGDAQSQADTNEQKAANRNNLKDQHDSVSHQSDGEHNKGSGLECTDVTESQRTQSNHVCGIQGGLSTDEQNTTISINTDVGESCVSLGVHSVWNAPGNKGCDSSLENDFASGINPKANCVLAEGSSESVKDCSNKTRACDTEERSDNNSGLVIRSEEQGSGGELNYDRQLSVSSPGTEKWKGFSSVELHAKLKEVDSDSALRIHPNNKRKIMRALEVYNQHQQPMSKMFKLQHSKQGASQVSGPLRYPNACVIWVQCEQTALDERTDRRVEQMVTEGLLEELEGFHQEYNQQRVLDSGEADYTLGIFQSIGFKEFHSYLLLAPEQRNTEEGLDLLKKGLEDMKLATRRYARRQKKWIVGRFLKRRGQNVPPVYTVDSTHKEQWMDNVHKPACEIVESFIQMKPPPYPPLLAEETKNQIVHNVCEMCGGMVFVTSDQWEIHLKSKRHQREKKRLKREANKIKEASKTVIQETESVIEDNVS